jgi:hypothetical protein
MEVVLEDAPQADLLGQHLCGLGEAEVLYEAHIVHGAEGSRALFDEAFQRQIVLLDQQLIAAVRVVGPQAGFLHVAVHIRGIELLALGEADDRLVAAQELQVGGAAG